MRLKEQSLNYTASSNKEVSSNNIICYITNFFFSFNLVVLHYNNISLCQN